MSDKARRFFSADSLDRAVLDAASHYGLAPEELRYEMVDKRGLAKRRKVVIRIDPEVPARRKGQEIKELQASGPTDPAASDPAASDPAASDPAASDPAASRRPPAAAGGGSGPSPAARPTPVSERGELSAPETRFEEPESEAEAAPPRAAAPAPQASAAPAERRPVIADTGMEIRLPANAADWFELLPEADVEERVAAERWTTALLELAGLELVPRVRQGDGQLEVHLSGADAEWLAEDDGEILLAIQHLLPRLMQSDLERLVSCRVDCGGFQLLHEERLRARAHWAAEEVRSEGRPVTLEPMPPADRRIIHLALVNDATVDTESLGRGFFKRVSVRPA
jgi:spoIIIJ-associated protein